MENETVQIAAATVTTLTPFIPLLTNTARFSAEAIAETVVQKGGEAAWQKAQALWGKIKARFGNDDVIAGAATMVAAQPQDESLQAVLASVLAERLQEDPELIQSLTTLLGGEQIVQTIVAERNSWVEDVEQRIKGVTGSQIVRASDDSVIIGVKQQAKKAS